MGCCRRRRSGPKISSMTRALAAGLLLAAALSARAGPLRFETIYPSTAGKNQVRWWEFNWRFNDFEPVAGAAPVRLYFYDSEREVARLAEPLIADAYTEYVETFAYKPTRRVPF